MLGTHRDSIVNLIALHHHSFDDDDKQLSDKDIASNEFIESKEDFIGLKIDDDEDDNVNGNDNDKAKIYKELNNLAIISTAREKDNRTYSSKDSSSSTYSDASDDDEYYDYYENYASGSVIWFDNKENKHSSSRFKPFECFFPCFPFMSNKQKQKTLEGKDDSEHNTSQQSENSEGVYDRLNSIPSNISDDESRNTYLYGKPLTELQHQAVLARLNLPEVRSSMPSHHALHNSVKLQEPDEGAGLSNGEKPKKLKGILKLPTPPEPGNGRSKSMNVLSQAQAPPRRALFPTSSKTYKSSEKKNIKFISLAKVSTIPSLSSMSFSSRSNVWWQKGEYDDFKKTARIITKALLTGGSEIWLSETKGKDNNGFNDDNKNTFGSKWWCKFGHSRRGLEHLCNINEGRNRQKNVKQATKAVVDEYRRQKVVSHFDDKRLALVSRQYTSWSRDLAHATALADQEGVKMNFHPNTRNRNDYVLQSMEHQHNYDMPDCTINVGDVVGVKLPQQTINPNISQISSSNPTHDPHMLDAHTRSSMVYRKHQLKSQHKKPLIEEQRQHGSESSLKKKASGYGVHGQKDINLSVLPRSKIGVV